MKTLLVQQKNAVRGVACSLHILPTTLSQDADCLSPVSHILISPPLSTLHCHYTEMTIKLEKWRIITGDTAVVVIIVPFFSRLSILMTSQSLIVFISVRAAERRNSTEQSSSH